MYSGISYVLFISATIKLLASTRDVNSTNDGTRDMPLGREGH